MEDGATTLEGGKTMFATPAEQLDLVRRWNQERRWGFTEDDFAAVSGGPPAGRRGRLVTDVLEIVLPAARGVPGLVRTFTDLLSIAFAPFAGGSCWDGFERLDAGSLRQAEGFAYLGKRLQWERIDLGAHRGVAPASMGSGIKMPGLCVLAASALHRRWLAAMEGQRVPYVWLPGLDVSLSSEKPWTAKPRLGFSQPTREVRLHAIEAWRCHQCWAVPAYV